MASKKDKGAGNSKPMRLPRSPFISPARKVGDLALKPLTDALGARGFAGPEIVAHWQAIVGAELAAFTAPDKIQWPREDMLARTRADGRDTGATLHIRAAGPGAIEVQHMADLILERINRFLGFQAVTRLRIVQAPVLPAQHSGDQRQRRQRPATEDAAVQIEGIADQRLAAALARLGTALRAARG